MALVRLRELGQLHLLWVRSVDGVELRAGEDVVGLVQREPGSSMPVEAQAAEGQWYFERRGLRKKSVHILHAGTGKLAGSFIFNRRGEGSLHLPSSPPYHWINTGAWEGTWAWQDVQGDEIVHLQGQTVRISPNALTLPELSLLALLGWYLMQLGASHDEHYTDPTR